MFSDGQGSKRRPVVVVHDFADDDLLVVPATSHPVRTANDVIVSQWKAGGLRLPTTIRAEKFATIEKSCVERKLGQLQSTDLARFKEVLEAVCTQLLR